MTTSQIVVYIKSNFCWGLCMSEHLSQEPIDRVASNSYWGTWFKGSKFSGLTLKEKVWCAQCRQSWVLKLVHNKATMGILMKTYKGLEMISKLPMLAQQSINSN